MCCGPYDYHYPVFGGRIQRADPEHGRVGSIFSDPNLAGSGPAADSNLVQPESRPPASIERNRNSLPPARGTLPRPDSEPVRPMVDPDAGQPGDGGHRLPSEGRWRPNQRGNGLR